MYISAIIVAVLGRNRYDNPVAQRTSDIVPAPERVLAVFVESYADFRKS